MITPVTPDAPIKLIAADLDGTLVDPSGALSPRVRRACAEAQERGVTLVLATSRRSIGAWPVAVALGGVAALILYDGAQVRAFPSGAIRLTHPLAAALGQVAAEVIYRHGLQPIAQYGDARGERLVAGPQPEGASWADAYLAMFERQVGRVPLERVCAGPVAPLRVVAFGPLPQVRQAARAVLARVPVAETIRTGKAVRTQVLAMGSYGAAELTVFAPGVSKGAALARLAAQLKVPLAQTMAIGDGLNDISMLRVAGLGVAMRGAPRALLRMAQATTGTNAEDGAAHAIERYVLGWAEAPTEAPAGDDRAPRAREA